MRTTIIRVRLKRDGSEHYFTSLAAIYDVLTRDDLGCSVTRLWQSHVREGAGFENSRCSVDRVPLVSKEQMSPRRAKRP